MTLETARIALVLGATGGIGGEVARRLYERGWIVRALHRNAEAVSRKETRFQWIQGDAMTGVDVARAAVGASLIVHAVNPPGYKDWDRLVLPMLDNTIAAARQAGARILLPGTVYNFGPDVFPDITEDSPQNPVTRKGAIRVEMEKRLARAADGGTRVMIVRAGDFFGPNAANSWFAQGVIKPGKPIRSVTNPGRPGLGHQWAYLPDVAETMIRLVETGDALPVFSRYHMEGHWDADGTGMTAAIQRVIGHRVPTKRFAWWLLPLAAPFVTVMRELREMRYLWKVPVRMTNDRLRAVLGSEPHTPIDDAVRQSLLSLGCLQPSQP